jgi:ubiquinone/menaquinone biosynthesis C-methylase UbiE
MSTDPKTTENIALFQSVDHTNHPVFFIRFLEAINSLESFQALKRIIVAQLQVQEGQCLLDVGCGIGDAVQALAPLVGGTGWVVGVDKSEQMIKEARRRVVGANLPVVYQVGVAHQLDFADQTFDGCRADRVLMYLEDPRLALAEMIRVARSGARIVVFDIDWDAVMVNHPDRELTRKIMQLSCESVRQGWMGRQLPALFQESGLSEVTITAHTLLIDYAVCTNIYSGLLQRAQEAGSLSDIELSRWWGPLRQASEQGLFFAAVPGFIACGRKP